MAIFAIRAVATHATRALKMIAALAIVDLLFATMLIAAIPTEVGQYITVIPILPAQPIRMELAIAIRIFRQGSKKAR